VESYADSSSRLAVSEFLEDLSLLQMLVASARGGCRSVAASRRNKDRTER
jgi:hypothetical protein